MQTASLLFAQAKSQLDLALIKKGQLQVKLEANSMHAIIEDCVDMLHD